MLLGASLSPAVAVRAARRATSMSLKTAAASAEDTVGGVKPHLADVGRPQRKKKGPTEESSEALSRGKQMPPTRNSLGVRLV
jgi:hypothetical protein